jgi:RES domain-containing protein
LCREPHAARTFSGDGAFRYGGRWSPPGLAVVYCAESRSLAAMEVLVHHLGTEVFNHTRWTMTAVDAPEALIEKPAGVPKDWRKLSPVADVQAFGAAWVRTARSAVLRVPSAVVLGEFNYLLNPAHADFIRLTIGKPEPFEFDARFKR